MNRLPRTRQAAAFGATTNRRGDRENREVKPQTPEIFVRVAHTYQGSYAQARIRVRKGCYQYLVWRDGEKTREYYLGKKESRTPHSKRPRPAPASSRSRLVRDRARGTK